MVRVVFERKVNSKGRENSESGGGGGVQRDYQSYRESKGGGVKGEELQGVVWGEQWELRYGVQGFIKRV